jgi:hypothetical protein
LSIAKRMPTRGSPRGGAGAAFRPEHARNLEVTGGNLLGVAWQLLRHPPHNSLEHPRERAKSLQRIVSIGFEAAAEVNAELAQPAAQRLPRDPQLASGLLLVSPRRVQ